MNPVIINQQAGPLPIQVTIPWPSTSTVVVAASGSAWTQRAGTTLAVNVTIGDVVIATMKLFANQVGTHMALPTTFTAIPGKYGNVTVTLTAANNTTITDQNDYFTVALLY